MVVTRGQSKIIINQFRNLSINQRFHMDAPVVKSVLSPFEVNINHGYSQGIKLYLQATK